MLTGTVCRCGYNRGEKWTSAVRDAAREFSFCFFTLVFVRMMPEAFFSFPTKHCYNYTQ